MWISGAGSSLYSIQVYQDFPSDLQFYVNVARGDARMARLLHSVYTQFNGDMRYFVETRGYPPDLARNEIERINAEVFKLVILAAVSMLQAGASASLIRGTAPEVASTAERTGFGRVGGPRSPAAASPTSAERAAGEAEVAAEGGIPRQEPPVPTRPGAEPVGPTPAPSRVPEPGAAPAATQHGAERLADPSRLGAAEGIG